MQFAGAGPRGFFWVCEKTVAVTRGAPAERSSQEAAAAWHVRARATRAPGRRRRRSRLLDDEEHSVGRDRRGASQGRGRTAQDQAAVRRAARHPHREAEGAHPQPGAHQQDDRGHLLHLRLVQEGLPQHRRRPGRRPEQREQPLHAPAPRRRSLAAARARPRPRKTRGASSSARRDAPGPRAARSPTPGGRRSRRCGHQRARVQARGGRRQRRPRATVERVAEHRAAEQGEVERAPDASRRCGSSRSTSVRPPPAWSATTSVRAGQPRSPGAARTIRRRSRGSWASGVSTVRARWRRAVDDRQIALRHLAGAERGAQAARRRRRSAPRSADRRCRCRAGARDRSTADRPTAAVSGNRAARNAATVPRCARIERVTRHAARLVDDDERARRRTRRRPAARVRARAPRRAARRDRPGASRAPLLAGRSFTRTRPGVDQAPHEPTRERRAGGADERVEAARQVDHQRGASLSHHACRPPERDRPRGSRRSARRPARRRAGRDGRSPRPTRCRPPARARRRRQQQRVVGRGDRDRSMRAGKRPRERTERVGPADGRRRGTAPGAARERRASRRAASRG